MKKKLVLGNLNAKRDWGHAKDFVEAQWLILQQKKPDDYVIATGKQYSVKQFVNYACTELGIKIYWRGNGIKEKAFDAKGNVIVECSKKYFRPAEVETLLGDPSKARKKLKWRPKVEIKELVKEMIESDLKILSKND